MESVEERVDPLFYRLMKVFMRGGFGRSLPPGNLDYLDCASLVAFMSRVIERAAAGGNCVVGRGAPYVQRGRANAFPDGPQVKANVKSDLRTSFRTFRGERRGCVRRYFRPCVWL